MTNRQATISQIFPVMYTAMGVFAFAFFVLLFVRIPEPNAATTTEPISTLMKGALKFPSPEVQAGYLHRKPVP